MKVAVISVHGCPCIPPGGTDAGGMNVYVGATSKELARLGHSVSVYSRAHAGELSEDGIASDGVELVHVPAGDVGLGKDDIADVLPEFAAEVMRSSSNRRRGFDLIAAHYWFSGLVAMQLKAELGLPTVFSYHTRAATKRDAHSHSSEPDARVIAERHIAEGADKIIAWTPEESRTLREDYGLDEDRIEICAPGVDCEAFAPVPRHEAKRSLPNPDAPTVLYVGRLDPFKGIDLMVEAFAEIRAVLPPARLVVAGDGDSCQREHFESLISRFGVGDSIDWLGLVEHSAMPRLYSAADVMVVPSFHETFGLAALEAAACGLPVVAAAVDGLRAIVRNSETGYLVSNRCASDYASAVLTILRDEALRSRMSARSRGRALERSWGTVARELADIYAEIVGAGKLSSAGSR